MEYELHNLSIQTRYEITFDARKLREKIDSEIKIDIKEVHSTRKCRLGTYVKDISALKYVNGKLIAT